MISFNIILKKKGLNCYILNYHIPDGFFSFHFILKLKNINEFVPTIYVTSLTRYILTDHQYLVKVSLMVHTIKHLFVHFLEILMRNTLTESFNVCTIVIYIAWYRGLKLCYCNYVMETFIFANNSLCIYFAIYLSSCWVFSITDSNKMHFNMAEPYV